MKSLARIVLFGFLYFTLTACKSSTPTEISVMTYNIRLDIAIDGNNAWPHRKGLLTEQLQRSAPDIFGLQEALPGQMKTIDAAMPGHSFIGHGRDGGDAGEYSAIFYDNAKFFVENERTFWLSETPDIFSQGFGAAYPRIASYGLFTHLETGKKFWVFNTHLDHKSDNARARGIALITATIETVNTQNHPVILMGDFNAKPNDALLTTLKTKFSDSRDISNSVPKGPNETFNDFGNQGTDLRRIDYIMLSKDAGLTIESYSVLRDDTGPLPSDHYPVLVNLSIQ
jgi:endonuclease/exonuclease/phosphatase family metal-dependent hydrolase